MRPVLLSRQPGRGDVTVGRGRAWLESRFSDRRQVLPASPTAVDVHAERGDHSLNAGLDPLPPLKLAAVLLPFVDRDGELSLIFTQRTAHLAHHAGQISFPGGHIEPDDGGPVETALRETEEEIGLDRQHITIIGRLETYVTRTGFIVTPVAGVVTPPFELAPDEHEVAEVFEVPLSHFLDPANHHHCSAEFEGVVRYFYAMPYEDYFIWGATAGMLMNLYEILTRR